MYFDYGSVKKMSYRERKDFIDIFLEEQNKLEEEYNKKK